jgi:hypothetical protein
MAEMGTSGVRNAQIRLADPKATVRVAPLPRGTVTLKVSVLCATPSGNNISPGPIMPEGFLTYTDFMPSNE